MGAAEPGNLAPAVRLKAFAPSGLAWKINRLRCMSAAEIGHRVVKAAAAHAERLGIVRCVVPAANLSWRASPWIHADARVNPAPILEAADRAIAGRFDVFALEDVDLGSPPRWNRDPKTGIEAPLSFGKQLDYRDASQVGDCKYLWEPNRHLHLVTLAQAYALSGQPRYAEALREHLDSWFVACPFRMGANWSSALEAALRLINWSAAWHLVGGVGSPLFSGEKGKAFRERWLVSVYQLAEFVSGHLSLHSSANNHLVGEVAGLYMAGVTWPHWERAQAWRARGREILEREALLQNAPDGVNREQAVSYQQWELDLLLIPLLAARANGEDFSAPYLARIEAMLVYVASIMDAGGNMPMFGDADDGFVVRLDARGGFCRYRSLLATGAILFGRGDLKAKAARLDDKSRWLFGSTADAAFDAVDTSTAILPIRREFPDGGYYVLGSDFETPAEVRIVADAGPLGYREIAAHGHADALSFTVSVSGLEFLVDPGTYAYHTDSQWREYFRGTAAHNTLRIDGLDQSQQGGHFMWLRKAKAHATRWASDAHADTLEAWHDGYRALADPVTHRRRFVFEKPTRRLVITDVLEMQGEHDVELFFHCHEAAEVRANELRVTVTRGGHRMTMWLPARGEVMLLSGSTHPIAGWMSRAFDRKTPAPVVIWRGRLSGNAVLTTEIAC